MVGCSLIGEMVRLRVAFPTDMSDPRALRFPGNGLVALPAVMKTPGGVILKCEMQKASAIRRTIGPGANGLTVTHDQNLGFAWWGGAPVSYTHLRAHETSAHL
eukprot:12112746-Alexandrium_andersonii.AAC.1